MDDSIANLAHIKIRPKHRQRQFQGLQMLKDGVSPDLVAQKLSVSPSTIVRWQQSLGLYRAPVNPARARTRERQEYVRMHGARLLEAGEKAANIARTLSVSLQTVRIWNAQRKLRGGRIESLLNSERRDSVREAQFVDFSEWLTPSKLHADGIDYLKMADMLRSVSETK